MKLRSNILIMGSVLAAILISIAVPVALAAKAPNGKALFTSKGCKACHSATAKFKFTEAITAANAKKAITKPPAGMPKSKLKAPEVKAISTYVASVTKNLKE